LLGDLKTFIQVGIFLKVVNSHLCSKKVSHYQRDMLCKIIKDQSHV